METEVKLVNDIISRLDAIEGAIAEMLEREQSRIHHDKIVKSQPRGLDPMEVNPEHIY